MWRKENVFFAQREIILRRIFIFAFSSQREKETWKQEDVISVHSVKRDIREYEREREPDFTSKGSFFNCTGEIYTHLWLFHMGKTTEMTLFITFSSRSLSHSSASNVMSLPFALFTRIIFFLPGHSLFSWSVKATSSYLSSWLREKQDGACTSRLTHSQLLAEQSLGRSSADRHKIIRLFWKFRKGRGRAPDDLRRVSTGSLFFFFTTRDLPDLG